MLTSTGSGSGKTKTLLNLINHQPDIDRTFQTKYQLLINKHERIGLKHFDDPKVFIEYSSNMDGIYKNIERTIQGKKCNVLMVVKDEKQQK